MMLMNIACDKCCAFIFVQRILSLFSLHCKYLASFLTASIFVYHTHITFRLPGMLLIEAQRILGSWLVAVVY